ncbi:MAG: hypothetical protein PHG08_08805 [Bacilli bacterium]|nr:hypothetical protein [Bacilli bacterium]
MDSSIGGYFELELSVREEYHNNALRLNTGRNAFEYVLRAKKYKKVYLPFYTCDAMLEPINKLGIDYEFYHIDQSFRPVFDFSSIRQEDVFVYNNYFGICDEQTREIAAQCKNLIIDNSQAFYSKPIKGVDTFYSPRKFFGLPDGAYLYTDAFLDNEFEQDISYERCMHLLGRVDTGAERNYKSFVKNDNALKEQPIKIMSELTTKLLKGIDYKNIFIRRKENFNYLHNALKNSNQLKFINIDEIETPMVYPYLISNGNSIKMELIKNKIFIASYWPNVVEWCEKEVFEYKLSADMISIPIDQRYDTENMKYIIEKISEFL